jgi:mersacidin/lichenicidin family type 2 lantibiotic
MSLRNKVDVIRAWKDPAYRASLNARQLADLPPSPAGEIELAPAELNRVVGGSGSAAAETVASARSGESEPISSESGGAAELVTPALKTYVCVFCCSQVSKTAFNFSAPR